MACTCKLSNIGFLACAYTHGLLWTKQTGFLINIFDIIGFIMCFRETVYGFLTFIYYFHRKQNYVFL